MVMIAGRAESDTLIRPSLTTGLKYDTNAFITAANDKDGDFIFSLTPEISVIEETKRATMDLQYRATGSYYFRHPELKSLSHGARAGASADLSPSTKLSLRDAASYTKEALQADPAGVQVKRSDIFTNTVSLTAEHTATLNTKLSIDLSDNVQKFKDPSLIDSRTDTVSAGVSHVLDPSTTITAGYSLKHLSYEGGGNDEFNVHSLTAGAARQLYPTVTATASAGLTYSTGVDDRYDWNGGASLSKRFQGSTLNLGYRRAVTNTTGLAAAINVISAYYADWDFRLTEFSNVKIFGNYSENRTNPSAVDVDTYAAGVTWSWRANQWTTLGAGYDHFRQRSSATADDYDRDQVTVTLTLAPYEWRF